MLLNHHLEECNDRYKTYMSRHDDLQRQMSETVRGSEHRLQEALDKQSSMLWNLVVRACGITLGAFATAVFGLAVYMMEHGVVPH